MLLMDTAQKNQYLKEGERFDDLQRDGLQIIQNPDLYCFSSDAVLLSDFAKIRYGQTAADLGTGSGIVAFLLAAKTKAKLIYGIELQTPLYDTAVRSAAANGLSDRVKIINADMRKVYEIIGCGGMDVVTVNPPYRKTGSGDKSAKNESTRLARHEVTVTLPEVIESAARLLKFGGKFYMIHRADRLDEIFLYTKQNNISIKTLQLVQPDADKPPHLVLIEGVTGGRAGVKILSNLIISEQENLKAGE